MRVSDSISVAILTFVTETKQSKRPLVYTQRFIASVLIPVKEGGAKGVSISGVCWEDHETDTWHCRIDSRRHNLPRRVTITRVNSSTSLKYELDDAL